MLEKIAKDLKDMTQKEKLDKATELAKQDIGHDRILSQLKNSVYTTGLTYGALGAATALGVKKRLGGKALKSLAKEEKNKVILDSLKNEGLKGMAAGGVGANFVVPNARLTAMHRKEFGTNPDLKDYATVTATHTLPTAAVWGGILHNKALLAKGAESAFNSAKTFKETKKLKDLKGVAHGLAGGGSMAAADKAADMLEYVATPESIITAKKRKLKEQGGDSKMENMSPKEALEIIDSAFEKQALIIKEAKEREKRIDAYKDYYKNDEYQRKRIDLALERAEGRQRRSELKNEMRYADTPEEKSKLKQKLSREKAIRNDKIVETVGNELNPVAGIKSLFHAIQATAKGAPHNLIISTPGQVFDNQAARTLAIKDVVKDREKHAFESDMEIIKEASSFMDILRGKNVQQVEEMMGRNAIPEHILSKVPRAVRKTIGGVNTGRSTLDIASRVPGAVDEIVSPTMDKTREALKNNKHVHFNDNGTISMNTKGRKRFEHLDDKGLEGKVKSINNVMEQRNNELSGYKGNINNAAKDFRKKTEGNGTWFDDNIKDKILKGHYERNAQKNKVTDELLNKVKSGADLTKDEQKQMRMSNRSLAKRMNESDIKDNVNNIRTTNAKLEKDKSILKSHKDEQTLRPLQKKIENYNVFKTVTNKANDIGGETSRVSNILNKNFTINGNEPKNELQKLHSIESAKTMAARAGVGLAAGGVGVAGYKALNTPAQEPQKDSGAKPLNPYDRRTYEKPRYERQNYNNGKEEVKAAYELIDSAFEKLAGEK